MDLAFHGEKENWVQWPRQSLKPPGKFHFAGGLPTQEKVLSSGFHEHISDYGAPEKDLDDSHSKGKEKDSLQHILFL